MEVRPSGLDCEDGFVVDVSDVGLEGDEIPQGGPPWELVVMVSASDHTESGAIRIDRAEFRALVPHERELGTVG
jgi:hypothetical protein